MKRLLFLLSLIIVAGCGDSPQPTKTTGAERIVTFSPVATEMVCALGARKNLVGCTTWCDYPQGVADNLVKIGNGLEFNLEQVIALAPTVIVANKSSQKYAKTFLNNGIKFVTINTHTIESINNSLLKVGKALNREAQAKTLLNDMKLPQAVTSKNPQKVLIIVDAKVENNKIKSAYIAGQNNWLTEIIAACGHKNAFTGTNAYALFSMENIILMQPDIIITIDIGDKVSGIEKRLQRWQLAKSTPAIKNKKLYHLTDNAIHRPGPRYPYVYKLFKEALKN